MQLFVGRSLAFKILVVGILLRCGEQENGLPFNNPHVPGGSQ
jgi:hypothetical protein